MDRYAIELKGAGYLVSASNVHPCLVLTSPWLVDAREWNSFEDVRYFADELAKQGYVGAVQILEQTSWYALQDDTGRYLHSIKIGIHISEDGFFLEESVQSVEYATTPSTVYRAHQIHLFVQQLRTIYNYSGPLVVVEVGDDACS